MGTIDIVGNEGRILFDDVSQSYGRAIAYADDKTEVELTCRFRFATITSGGTLRFTLRGSATWFDWGTPNQGYELGIPNTSGNFTLNRVSGGTRTPLQNVAWTPTTNWYSLRFRITSAHLINARIWETSSSEPFTWDINLTDGSPLTNAGTLMVGYFRTSAGTHTAYVDNILYDNLATLPSGLVVSRGLENIFMGVIASTGGGHSGLHPIEAGYIT